MRAPPRWHEGSKTHPGHPKGGPLGVYVCGMDVPILLRSRAQAVCVERGTARARRAGHNTA